MDTNGISETVSENQPKPKRGRPALMAPELFVMLSRLYPEHTTKRSIQNVHYRCRAHELVATNPDDFLWLVDEAKVWAGGRGGYKSAILNELGRIDDDDDLLSIARQICELKPTAREAVRMIRRWRLGKAPEASAVDLTLELAKVVDDYRGRHPDLTTEQVGEALANVQKTIDSLDWG